MLNKIKSILTPWNLFILIILLLAFILRIYRIGELLDFHYDQGRDAMVMWNLWHNNKLFLIGPVTGLPGIFLGPFYYYLIAPFYLIGSGNPTIPSIFLSFLTTLGLFYLYKTGELIGDRKLGLISLIIGSFSSYIVLSSRWLSNPTPILLTSIIIFYYLVRISKFEKIKTNWFYIVYLLVGVSMHFESASAAFYLPVLAVFTYWQRKKINFKYFLVCGFLIFLTFAPQLIFNLKHDNLLIKNIIAELPEQERNNSPILRILTDRFKLFGEMYSSKLFHENNKLSVIFSSISLFGLIMFFKNKKNIFFLKLISIFLGIPFVLYTFYRGNHGFLYDYYFTGYYLIIILFFSIGIWSFSKLKIGKYVLFAFILLFLFNNIGYLSRKLTVGINDGNDIFLGNQLEAITWIYDDAKDDQFNVDVYVPPVIPHSYEYLFVYVGDKRSTNMVSRLYTLYEIDPPHPERLEAWIARQEGIGKVLYEQKFGGIVVQRRERINKK